MILSQTDAFTPFALFQMGVSALVSLAIWRLTGWQRRAEGVERRLQEESDRLIDERLRSVCGVVETHGRTTLVALEELRQRVTHGEQQIAAMADRDLKIELTLAAKLDHLKDYIRDFAAGRTDLERYESAVDRRLTRIETRLEELGK